MGEAHTITGCVLNVGNTMHYSVGLFSKYCSLDEGHTRNLHNVVHMCDCANIASIPGILWENKSHTKLATCASYMYIE